MLCGLTLAFQNQRLLALLGATLGYLAEKKEDRVNSATFFVSLLDFSMPGELGVFIDEAQVENLEKKMNERGYLEGSEMASTFNLLRANDLVWSFVINNYLMGKDPFPFDLLYWNADSTRMPAAMHSYYLRNMYQKNLLAQPGGLIIDNVPIDLRKISIPIYLQAGKEDHIAPAKSVYKATQVYSGPVRFMLAGSGHIAGVVTASGEAIPAGAVVLTTGTFLRGLIHIGEVQIPAGRALDENALEQPRKSIREQYARDDSGDRPDQPHSRTSTSPIR